MNDQGTCISEFPSLPPSTPAGLRSPLNASVIVPLTSSLLK